MDNTRIMIVEDEWLIAEDLRHNLERLGYGVSAMASTGEEAVAAVRADPPSLVLMDIMLAGPMDGIEAAGVIREACGVPVLFLTAYTDQGVLDRAKRAEPVGYLVKPFEERELHSTIEMALYKHAMERKLRYRLEMEELVSGISALFSRSPAEAVDDALAQAVERIGRYTGAECCYLMLFEEWEERREGDSAFCWSAPDHHCAELPTREEMESFPLCMNRFRQGRSVPVPNRDGADDGVDRETERRWLTLRGVGSSLVVPVSVGERLLGLFAIDLMDAERGWPEDDRRLLGTVAEIIAGTLERRKAELHALELAGENRRLAQRLISVQEEERRILARELHDEMGQWLASIQADAQVIRTLSGERDPRVRESIDSIAECSRRVNGVVRQMMGRLRPAVLDELGLEDGLREYLNGWRARHPELKCHFESPGDLADLADLGGDGAITIFRMVQEALTNVVRHAKATRVEVCISREADGALSVVVEDDGAGMVRQRRPGGMGLLGMRERVMALGGELVIDSELGRGTRVSARLPVESAPVAGVPRGAE